MKYCLAITLVLFSFCSVHADQAPTFTDLSQISERADILLARRSYAEAATEFQRALKISPKDQLLHNKLGVCYQRLGQLALAEREYDQARKLDPKSSSAWNNLGTVQFSRGNFKQAIKSYRKAVQLKPDMAIAHQNLACAYLASNRFEQAIEAFQEAVRFDPEILQRTATEAISVQTQGSNPGLQSFYYAKVCAMHGRMDDALLFLDRAVKQGFKDLDKVVKDPAFKDLAKDPRFIELSRSVG